MVAGLRAFAGGIGFILTTPRVWLYALVPTVMLLLVLTVLGVLGIWGAVQLTHVVWGEASSTWGQVASWLLAALLAGAALLLAALLALFLAQPLSGFALEAIAHAQHEALTGQRLPRPSFFTSLLGTLKVVLVALAVGAPVLTVLTIVNVLFPPAAFLVVPLKVLVAGWMLAWDFLDYPMGIRQLGLRARLAWVGRHFRAFSAFGVAWALVIVVPGMVLLLLPMGVAGAARLVVEAETQPTQ
jgi:CysZ protein